MSPSYKTFFKMLFTLGAVLQPRGIFSYRFSSSFGQTYQTKRNNKYSCGCRSGLSCCVIKRIRHLSSGIKKGFKRGQLRCLLFMDRVCHIVCQLGHAKPWWRGFISNFKLIQNNFIKQIFWTQYFLTQLKNIVADASYLSCYIWLDW